MTIGFHHGISLHFPVSLNPVAVAALTVRPEESAACSAGLAFKMHTCA
ncbi:hypothetical protein NMD1_00510 [Novosphingobium sp. MD-1]|nr:hypothetical protein NMD1_00510 [Novosphingobium sp. MD-1]